MSKTQNLNRCGVVILAAGHGKRMKSPLPKVLHLVSGKPILYHVLKQVIDVIPEAPVAIVVGVGRDAVQAYVHQEPSFRNKNIQFIIQSEQNGTGHAMQCVIQSAWGKTRIQNQEPLLVLPGDSPLLSVELIQQMTIPLSKNEALRLLVCHLPDPKGYGRIIRAKGRGSVLKIVEEKDATTQQKKIQEVAVSMYLWNGKFLETGLQVLNNKNAQGEYYLTDVVGLAARKKKKVAILSWPHVEDLKGINDLWELALVNEVMNLRLMRRWAQQGVYFASPQTTRVDAEVNLAAGVRIEAGVLLLGCTSIAENVTIGPRVVLKDMTVEAEAVLKVGTVAESSHIGAGSQIGPYAHLRPGSVIGAKTKIGNFVELKKTKIGNETSIAHLSYLGDAEVGHRVNIGCGFITCNFDGRSINGERKHRTIIQDDVFLGSDCQTVAPVVLEKGSYVASGSTITENVPAGALAVARTRQINKLDYAKKLKQKS